MNCYLNTRVAERRLYGYWLEDRLPSPSVDLKHMHTRASAANGLLLYYLPWWGEGVMVSLASELLSCLSAEV